MSEEKQCPFCGVDLHEDSNEGMWVCNVCKELFTKEELD